MISIGRGARTLKSVFEYAKSPAAIAPYGDPAGGATAGGFGPPLITKVVAVVGESIGSDESSSLVEYAAVPLKSGIARANSGVASSEHAGETGRDAWHRFSTDLVLAAIPATPVMAARAFEETKKNWTATRKRRNALLVRANP